MCRTTLAIASKTWIRNRISTSSNLLIIVLIPASIRMFSSFVEVEWASEIVDTTEVSDQRLAEARICRWLLCYCFPFRLLDDKDHAGRRLH